MIEQIGSSRIRSDSTQGERGSAIVETALMLPVLLAVAALVLTAIAVSSAAIHLGDTAHELARALARGESQAQVMSVAARAAPSAQLEISAGEGLVEVSLRQEVDIPVPILERFSFAIERTASAPQEWT